MKFQDFAALFVLAFIASFAPRMASAGILTASSVPPDGSTLNVNDTLVITLVVDPSQIPSVTEILAEHPDAQDGIFQLTLGFDFPQYFEFLPESSMLDGETPFPEFVDPNAFFVDLTIIRPFASPPAVPDEIPIALTFKVLQSSLDPITFFADLLVVFEDESDAFLEADDHQELKYMIDTTDTTSIPEPSGLTISAVLLGLFGAGRGSRAFRRRTFRERYRKAPGARAHCLRRHEPMWRS